MFLKRSIGVLLLTALCSTSAAQVFAADDPPKIISLGLSAATAMVSEKDVVKGLKTAAKDEYTSWMWDLIGGTEKFIFQNSEADLPVIKDKINNVISVVGQIEKFSIAMTEGKYDDAAFAAIDQVVSTVNHPLVSVTWEMAKLTYESHKLVQESGAALKVEVLFGMMNNDRRLMGTADPKSDTPPMIPESADSADYFFNKYVMTNDAARAALQAYVTTVLGEEWPEQSWGDWIGSFAAVGSGVDTVKSDEIEMLDGEWRNKGRTWVMSAIKEVNKLAKQAWAEARLRQQLEEFKKFSERVGHFYNGDFAQMLKEFQAVKQIQADIPNYPQYLTQSQAERKHLAAKAGALKPKEAGSAGGMLAAAEGWYYKCLAYSSRAGLVKDTGFAASFSQEMQQWKTIMEQLQRLIDGQRGQVVSNAEQEITTEILAQGSNPFFEKMAPYAKQYFAEISKTYSLEEMEWVFDVPSVTTRSGATYDLSADVAQTQETLLKACNEGNLADAQEVLNVWKEAAAKHFEDWQASFDPIIGVLPELAVFVQQKNAADAAVEAVHKELEAFSRSRAALSASLPGCPDERNIDQCNAIYRSNTATMQAFDAGVRPIKQRLEVAQLEQAAVVNGWNAAVEKAKETAGRLIVISGRVYAENIAKPAEVVGAFQALADARRQEYEKFKGTLEYVSRTLPYDVEEVIKAEEASFQRLQEEVHTYVVPMKEENPNPLNAGALLQGLALDLSLKGGSPSSELALQDNYEKLFSTWEQAVELWKTSPQLDEQDILQIEALVKPDFDLKKEVDRVKKAVAASASAPARIKSILARRFRVAETDRDNRDKDSYWLIEKSREVNRYFREQTDKGQLSNYQGLQVALPGMLHEGMVKVEQPYPHYMTDKELRELSQKLTGEYKSSPAFATMQKYLPGHHAVLMKILGLDGIKGAKGENFFVRHKVVYVEDMEKAEALISKLSPKSTDYAKVMVQVAELMPLTVMVTTQDLPEPVFSMYSLDITGEGVDQHPGGKRYVELREKISTIIDEYRGAEILKQQAAARARTDAEVARREAEAARKAEQEHKAVLDNMDPYNLAGYYGYAVEDARLNSKSLRNAHGEVVLTRQDLVAGQMNIDVRLFTIDKMQALLLSEDGGRTWRELTVSKALNFTVDPLPGKAYDLVLRVKTTDEREVMMRVFNGVTSIIYQDIDFSQLVAQTVKDLADAYERQDIMSFSELISREYLGNKASLEEGARFDFDLFNAIRLTIYINRIQQRGNMFVAETKWDKAQTPRKTGQEQMTSGRTTFMFVIEDGKMKIKNLRGDLIYATLSADIAQASGKSSAVVNQIRTAYDARNPVQPGAGTTEDDGGVSSGDDNSDELLTVHTVTVTSAPGMFRTEYIDFETATTGLGAGGDINFGGNIFFESGSADIDLTGSGEAAFNALDAVPGDFADDGGFGRGVTVGDVYVILTDQGNYVKMYISNVIQYPGPDDGDPDHFDTTVKFAISPDGSTSLATQ